MSSQQRQSVRCKGVCSDEPFDSRNSDSTASATQHSGISQSLEKAFDQLDGRFKRTFICQSPVSGLATQRVIRKLIDWLVSVCWSYSIDESGLFQAAALMTNFLRNRNVEKRQLQAVAMTSLLIASKYTQVKKLTLKDAVEFCSGIYSAEEIAQLQGEVLLLYECDLEIASTHRYMEEWLWQGSLTEQQQNEVNFWLEIQLMMQESCLYAREIFSDVLNFVLNRHTQNEPAEQAKLPTSDFIIRLIRFARDMPYTTILKKYMSKFDTDNYLKECCPEATIP